MMVVVVMPLGASDALRHLLQSCEGLLSLGEVAGLEGSPQGRESLGTRVGRICFLALDREIRSVLLKGGKGGLGAAQIA
jgi:hypothetical protein